MINGPATAVSRSWTRSTSRSTSVDDVGAARPEPRGNERLEQARHRRAHVAHHAQAPRGGSGSARRSVRRPWTSAKSCTSPMGTVSDSTDGFLGRRTISHADVAAQPDGRERDEQARQQGAAKGRALHRQCAAQPLP